MAYSDQSSGLHFPACTNKQAISSLAFISVSGLHSCHFTQVMTFPTSSCIPLGNTVHTHVHIHVLPYSRKLSREKTFANFTILWLFVKVFSAKFGGVVVFGKSEQSAKVFSAKIVFSPICGSFLPQSSFLLYSTITSILEYYSILQYT